MWQYDLIMSKTADVSQLSAIPFFVPRDLVLRPMLISGMAATVRKTIWESTRPAVSILARSDCFGVSGAPAFSMLLFAIFAASLCCSQPLDLWSDELLGCAVA